MVVKDCASCAVLFRYSHSATAVLLQSIQAAEFSTSSLVFLGGDSQQLSDQSIQEFKV